MTANPNDATGKTQGPTFGSRVAEAVGRTGPVCLGIDPSPTLLRAWGCTDDGEGLFEFGERCIEAWTGVVPVVKPQVAFFERHGSAGFTALEKLFNLCADAGILVIADGKRGDISTTAEAYASAWLEDRSPLRVDAMTVHPYLGLDALTPILKTAIASGRGVLVVVRSSNPEGRPVQQAVVAGKADEEGSTVEDTLLGEIAGWNARSRDGAGKGDLGAIGAVIGATMDPTDFQLDTLGGVILAPGVGAQGATPKDVARRFAGCQAGSLLPSVSRSVLRSGPDVDALRSAAISVRDELSRALSAPD